MQRGSRSGAIQLIRSTISHHYQPVPVLSHGLREANVWLISCLRKNSAAGSVVEPPTQAIDQSSNVEVHRANRLRHGATHFTD